MGMRLLAGVLVFLAAAQPAQADRLGGQPCTESGGGLVPLTRDDVKNAAKAVTVPDIALWALLHNERGRVGECCSTRGDKRYCAADNRDKGRDCGPFQINEINFPQIARGMGVSTSQAEAMIRDNGCVNAHVAAWILRKNLPPAEGDLWEAMGLYHSATPHFKALYHAKLREALRTLVPIFTKAQAE